MKFFTILTIICSLIVTIHCSVLRKWLPNSEVVGPLENCSAGNNINKELGLKLVSHQVDAKTKDEKCFLGCYLKERRFLVDHEIKWQLLSETHVAHVTNDDESLKEKIKEVFKKCEENFSYKGKDDCQVAYEAYKCHKAEL